LVLISREEAPDASIGDLGRDQDAHGIQNTLERCKSRINRYDGGKNGVLQFILGDFDPASPNHGRFEGQIKGNHFTWGITVYGFKRVLVIIQWGKYKRDPNFFATGEHNGYDLCEQVRTYMRKIGKPHLSMIEAIMSGEVEELLCLQSEVGPADCFFSHVQAVAVASTVETLKDAEKRYEEELLTDRGAEGELRKQALEEFLRENGRDDADSLISHFQSTPSVALSWAAIEGHLQEHHGFAPALVSFTAKKKHTRPRLFVDYFNIRQCIKNDFATDRLVDAINTIGITLVELGADFRAESALLKRVFCVLELFATIKSKGELLVCGPAMGGAATAMELATMAANKERCQEVMDSSSSRTRSAEAESEIKAYIERTVGFVRTDKVVLSAIVAGCVRSAEPAFDETEDRGMSVLLAVGCMLYEVGDYRLARVQVEVALVKGEAAYGVGAFETAEAIYMLGQCHCFTDGKCMVWYERSLRMNEEKHGKEHAATARSLVGIGSRHALTKEHPEDNDYAKGLECFNLAITRIEASNCPSDHADAHADALAAIAGVYVRKREWQKVLLWSERSVQMRESKHGVDHALVVHALGDMATAYKYLNPEKAMALQLRVLGIEEKSRGRLSLEVGNTCFAIGNAHYWSNGMVQASDRYSVAAGWFKRAVEAMEYTSGPAASLAERYRGCLKNAIDEMDPTDAKTKEYRRFLEGGGQGAGGESKGQKARHTNQHCHNHRTEGCDSVSPSELNVAEMVEKLAKDTQNADVEALFARLDTCEKVSVLNLGGCDQVTALPHNFGQQFLSLQEFEATGAALEALPESILKLTNLKKLILNRNKLTALPESISRLSCLQSLRVAGNQLSELPSSIGNLKSLKDLSISNNKSIEELPPAIGDLECLEMLDCSVTGLKELPSTIGNLRSLRVLTCRYCALLSLPDSICRLSRLEELDFTDSQLSELPAAISELKSLKLLTIQCDSKLATLPDSFGHLPALKELYLQSDKMALPSSFALLTSLEVLDIRGFCRVSAKDNARVRKVLKHGVVNIQEIEHTEAMVQARQVSSIRLEGQEEGELHHDKMGVYKLLEGKEVNMRGVWKKMGEGVFGEDLFLYYSLSNSKWGVTKYKSQLERTGGMYGLSVESFALTPDEVTETWRDNVQEIPKLKTGVLSFGESAILEHAANIQEIEHTKAMVQARQVGSIRLEGQEEGELHHDKMGVYKLLEGKEVNMRGVWKKMGLCTMSCTLCTAEDLFLYYSSSSGKWGVGTRGEMEDSNNSAPYWLSVESAALTPDEVTETWKANRCTSAQKLKTGVLSFDESAILEHAANTQEIEHAETTGAMEAYRLGYISSPKVEAYRRLKLGEDDDF
jgi:hypothetical protein